MTSLKIALAAFLAAFLSMANAGEIKPYSQAQFDMLTASGKPVVLAVHADWCPTCKAQKPILDALMSRAAFKDVTTLTIDFDTDTALLTRYKVARQSTLIAFKGTREVGRTVGDTTPSGIEDLLKKTVN